MNKGERTHSTRQGLRRLCVNTQISDII